MGYTKHLVQWLAHSRCAGVTVLIVTVCDNRSNRITPRRFYFFLISLFKLFVWTLYSRVMGLLANPFFLHSIVAAIRVRPCPPHPTDHYLWSFSEASPDPFQLEGLELHIPSLSRHTWVLGTLQSEYGIFDGSSVKLWASALEWQAASLQTTQQYSKPEGFGICGAEFESQTLDCGSLGKLLNPFSLSALVCRRRTPLLTEVAKAWLPGFESQLCQLCDLGWMT